VVNIEHESKRVLVGKKDDLKCRGLLAGNVNWIEPPDEAEMLAEVQIRYRAPAIPCIIQKAADGDCEVRFMGVFSAVTPGQAAVFYRGDQLLGGGWIEGAVH
jgi:tRNA-specific 2-thiouridylase